MMLDPSIDQLQEKIKSKYVLVQLSARRARELEDGDETILEDSHSKTKVGVALEEIADGKLFVAGDK